MIRSFRKFFEFAGRQSRNWYLGLFYEIIRCILEALQFAALLVVLDGLVRDNASQCDRHHYFLVFGAWQRRRRQLPNV